MSDTMALPGTDTNMIPARRAFARKWVKVLLLVSIVAYGVWLVTDSYRTLSHTTDAPAHIATGLELIDHGTYTYERQHPPIARVAVAIGPWLLGARSNRDTEPVMYQEGERIIYQTGEYRALITAARLGNLPFFLLLLLGTWILAKPIIGRDAAILALFFTVTIPPVAGNAGLATLDIAPIGFALIALHLFCNWLDSPNRRTAIGFGVFAAASMFCKLSFIPFLAVACAALFAWRCWIIRRAMPETPKFTDEHRKGISPIIWSGFLVGWAAYGFQLAPLVVHEPGAQLGLLQRIVAYPVYPAVLQHLSVGLLDVARLSAHGWGSYLLGETGRTGWWYYYPVGLFYKTPLPVLIAGLVGFFLLVRESLRLNRWQIAMPAIVALAVLAFCTTSRINLGIRHVMIVYPLLAIAAAWTIIRLIEMTRHRAAAIGAAGLIVTAQLASSIAAHPDNFNYFNFIAGDRPEGILINVDLDWDQDLWRLEDEVRRRGIESISVAYNDYLGGPKYDNLPNVTVLNPGEPATGWIALGLWTKTSSGAGFDWLKPHQPVARIGTSIDLYFVPDGQTPK